MLPRGQMRVNPPSSEQGPEYSPTRGGRADVTMDQSVIRRKPRTAGRAGLEVAGCGIWRTHWDF
jgi:hypothetical protein